MDKKLFRLRVEYDTVVTAETKENLESNADYFMKNEIDEEPVSVDVREIKSEINILNRFLNKECTVPYEQKRNA